MPNNTKNLIEQYYAAFNQQDWPKLLDLLDEQVIHDINQGQCEIGKDKFTKFLHHMDRCYKEAISALCIMVSEDGSRAATEFTVSGQYLTTDNNLPPAHGQTYQLPCGAFFSIKGNKITRVTLYYNLQDWLKQVSSPCK